jgi:probable F420-dependent oxidoreductase
VKLGFALPHIGPIASTVNIRKAAQEAEDLGYHSLWTNERVLVPVDPKTPYPGTADGKLNPEYDTVFEHLTVLTYASAVTSRIRLGVSVINIPFYNPVMLGRRVATMDQLSDGRITLGVGLAWSEDECDVNNVPFKERGRIGEEAIEALKAVWGPDPVEYHGRHFDIPASVIGPKPVQKPHPPILVGAFVPKALDRAGRLADGFTGCCAPVEALITMMNAVKEAAQKRGRDAGSLQFVMRCLVTRTDQPVEGEGRAVAVGSWDQIRSDVRRMAEAGVDEAFFDVAFQPDVNDLKSYLGYMERFREIMPSSVAPDEGEARLAPTRVVPGT